MTHAHSVEREEIFLLNIPQLPEHWPLSTHSSWGQVFLLRPAFSQEITMGWGGGGGRCCPFFLASSESFPEQGLQR